jgi:hypothetical protein
MDETPPLITHEEQQASYKRAVRATLATRIFVIYVLIATTLTSSVLLFLAVQDHHRIKQNQEIQQFIKAQAITNGQLSQRNGELLKEVRSCTQPDGKCFKDGQKRTGEAVVSIGLTSVAAASCSVHIGVAHPELSQVELTRLVTICTTKAVTR